MKAAIYTLGCKVNTYESEVVKQKLIDAGYEIVDFHESADFYLINTCTVTNTGANKSKKTIRQAIKRNQTATIIVMGCLPQTAKEELETIDGIDIIIGNKDKTKIIDLINEHKKKKKQVEKIYDLTNVSFEDMELTKYNNQTRAFVKIQDGCNNFCSYCIIPYARGDVRSKELDIVIDEVSQLVKNGFKEIVLTGIHTGNYGIDKNTSFVFLVRQLLKIHGLERLRISSIEITEINDEFLTLLKNSEVLVDHMHIPLQAGSNTILKKMNRKYNTDFFLEQINKIRSVRPTISITTDVIVGFPHETDELFEETVSFIKRVKFSKLHVFPYSKRKGTPASNMSNQVDERIKKQRVHELLELSKILEKQYYNTFIGKTLTIIGETEKNGVISGYTTNYLHLSTPCSIEKLGSLIPILVKGDNNENR